MPGASVASGTRSAATVTAGLASDGAMVFMFGAQPAIKSKATAKPAA
jgi:hypothetical protein